MSVQLMLLTSGIWDMSKQAKCQSSTCCWHQFGKRPKWLKTDRNCKTKTAITFSPGLRFRWCNIPSFQKSEKSEKFKTFSNYMYFALKRNFMHCMHHLLVLFAFACLKDWNIIFQFKIYLTKLYVWVIPNIIFWCLPSLI